MYEEIEVREAIEAVQWWRCHYVYCRWCCCIFVRFLLSHQNDALLGFRPPHICSIQLLWLMSEASARWFHLSNREEFVVDTANLLSPWFRAARMWRLSNVLVINCWHIAFLVNFQPGSSKWQCKRSVTDSICHRKVKDSGCCVQMNACPAKKWASRKRW